MSRLKVDNIEARSGNNVSVDDPFQLKSYTTTQRDALTSVAGDVIYNSTLGNPQVYDGSSWNYHSIDAGTNRGCESDIVIDGNDHIYISYQVRAQSKLKVATNKSGSWNLYAVDSGATTSSL